MCRRPLGGLAAAHTKSRLRYNDFGATFGGA
jgi:hypothetical protein